MFGKILVVTDGSEYSRHALSVAIELAKQNDSKITLLHVINPQPYQIPPIAAHYFQQLVQEIGKKTMEKTVKGIDECQVPIEKKIRIGNAAREILAEIKEGEAELAVMGARGQGALRAAVMGSVAQKVVAEAGCPVLVVK